ncbi:MAG: MlaA family lipoprotein, partial [Stellaceae bacterium]
MFDKGNPVLLANRKKKPRPVWGFAVGLLLCCCGCAATPQDAATADDVGDENDPAEPVNRAIFKANVAADHAVIKPVAQAYVDHVPE